MLDKYGKVCYNDYSEREITPNIKYIKSEEIKMRFWDNDFDRMFDEAVEEFERDAQICAQWEEEEANRFF